MRRAISVFMLLSMVNLLLWNSSIFGQDKKEDKKDERGAVILSLKEEGKVDQNEDVEGELKTDGWPVFLVKPLEGGNQPWWIQAPIDEVKERRFIGQVIFGADDTKAGSRLRVVIVVAKTKEEAMKFERGKTRTTLPPGLPKSEMITVVRK